MLLSGRTIVATRPTTLATFRSTGAPHSRSRPLLPGRTLQHFARPGAFVANRPLRCQAQATTAQSYEGADYSSYESVSVPVEYYKLLQVSKTADRKTIKSAYDRLSVPPRTAKYSHDTLFSRAILLKSAFESLGDVDWRRSYDKQLMSGYKDLQVFQSDLPGALLLLQESGEFSKVIELAEAWMKKHYKKSTYAADVATCLALAFCDRAGYELERNVSRASKSYLITVCEDLERASWLLTHYNMAPELLEQIQDTLMDYSPVYAYELLGLPLSPEHEDRRATGLSVLHAYVQRAGEEEVLALKHEGGGSPQKRRRHVLEGLLGRCRPLMTAGEQICLDAVIKQACPWSLPGHSYWTALALIADGVTKRLPHHVYKAERLFHELESAAAAINSRSYLGRPKKGVPAHPLYLEKAICTALLGDQETAMALLGLTTSQAGTPTMVFKGNKTWKQAPEGSVANRISDLEIIKYIKDNSPDSSNLQPGLHTLVERWVQDAVLRHFREHTPPVAAPRTPTDLTALTNSTAPTDSPDGGMGKAEHLSPVEAPTAPTNSTNSGTGRVGKADPSTNSTNSTNASITATPTSSTDAKAAAEQLPPGNGAGLLATSATSGEAGSQIADAGPAAAGGESTGRATVTFKGLLHLEELTLSQWLKCDSVMQYTKVYRIAKGLPHVMNLVNIMLTVTRLLRNLAARLFASSAPKSIERPRHTSKRAAGDGLAAVRIAAESTAPARDVVPQAGQEAVQKRKQEGLWEDLKAEEIELQAGVDVTPVSEQDKSQGPELPGPQDAVQSPPPPYKDPLGDLDRGQLSRGPGGGPGGEGEECCVGVTESSSSSFTEGQPGTTAAQALGSSSAPKPTAAGAKWASALIHDSLPETAVESPVQPGSQVNSQPRSFPPQTPPISSETTPPWAVASSVMQRSLRSEGLSPPVLPRPAYEGLSSTPPPRTPSQAENPWESPLPAPQRSSARLASPRSSTPRPVEGSPLSGPLRLAPVNLGDAIESDNCNTGNTGNTSNSNTINSNSNADNNNSSSSSRARGISSSTSSNINSHSNTDSSRNSTESRSSNSSSSSGSGRSRGMNSHRNTDSSSSSRGRGGSSSGRSNIDPQGGVRSSRRSPGYRDVRGRAMDISTTGYDDEMAHNPKQARRLRNQLDSMERKMWDAPPCDDDDAERTMLSAVIHSVWGKALIGTVAMGVCLWAYMCMSMRSATNPRSDVDFLPHTTSETTMVVPDIRGDFTKTKTGSAGIRRW